MERFGKLAMVVATAAVMVGCATYEIEGYSVDEMAEKSEARIFVADNGVTLPYRIYNSNYERKNPLVVVLHGSGERGNDNVRQLKCGVGEIAEFVDRYAEDAVIVAPQCPDERYWKSEDVMEALYGLVSMMKTNAWVDAKKVYVTGFSMGGEGTWIFSLKHPEMVTTLVPLCGGPLADTPYGYDEVDERMKGKNVWAFNYFDDTMVDNTYSREVTARLWGINTNCVHYTEMMEGGHTAEMYKSKKLLQWLFGTK